jgi:hypothetical protein
MTLVMAGLRLWLAALHGHQVHAALRTVTGLIGDHLGVHRAGVLGRGGVLGSPLFTVLRVFGSFYGLLLSHGVVSVTVGKAVARTVLFRVTNIALPSTQKSLMHKITLAPGIGR